MNKFITVKFRETEVVEFPTDTTLLEISESFQKYYNYPILIGRVNNDIVELSEKVSKDCTVEFYDRSSAVGNSAYSRSLQFMLVLATKRLFGPNTDVMIEHSIDKGFYCEIIGKSIDKPDIKLLEQEMKKISKEDLKFVCVSVSRLEAMDYYKKKRQYDKVNALKYISNTYVNLYRLDNVYDYFYDNLVYSSKQVDDFKLHYIKDNGFAVNYPTSYNPECTLDYVHHKMVFDAHLDYTNWGRKLDYSLASDLNRFITTGRYDEVIRLAEAYYNGQLIRVADTIYDKRKQVKLVLIAGPSSSGKTTTAKKLEVYLRAKGLTPHKISIDDYFVDRKDMIPNEKGELDFESLKAVDTNLFNKHLTKLLEGQKVLLPTFNFVLGKKEYKDNYLQLGEKDVIIVEGLHALTDELTLSIDNSQKYKIYIGPLTQLNIDNHNRIFTSDTRKLRRIVRDNKFRGYNASRTLSMWKNIREGEERNIFPYQDSADVVVNTALVYELAVLKVYAEPLLFSVEETDPVYPEAIRLINLLRNFLPMPSDAVPSDSVLREFIGGSCFE